MTNLQDDLTAAFVRRANDAIVEDQLDAILTDTNVIRLSQTDEPSRRRGSLLAVAAGAVVLIGAAGMVWATTTRTDPPATSSAPPAPVDTAPSWLPVADPTQFPSEVPKPEMFESMQIMTDNGAPVGWEFYEQGLPTSSVERCTQYASAFDPSWTATADTDEAPEVIYAQSLTNGQWDVGVYCHVDGSNLVQVMPTGTKSPILPDTVWLHSADLNATSDTAVPDATDPGAPAGTAAPSDIDSTNGAEPAGPVATIPQTFPDVVPRPDTFQLMTFMWSGNDVVGWQFSDQTEATTSVERCEQYASTFGSEWTGAPITGESDMVLYAHSFTNDDWRVTILCTNDGTYQVQVTPTAS